MSLAIKSGEHGVVRVFLLGYRVSMEMQHFEAVDRLAAVLGAGPLVAEDVQIVDLSTLRDMGFATFLSEAYGVSERELAPHTPELNAMKGHVAILRSSAFGGAQCTLRESNEAKLVATLHEPKMSAPQPMPNYESAGGSSGNSKARKPVSEKAMSGRIAMYALLAIFAFTFMFVWIAS